MPPLHPSPSRIFLGLSAFLVALGAATVRAENSPSSRAAVETPDIVEDIGTSRARTEVSDGQK